VFEHEPMRDPDNPLLKLENVICTPHLGYVEINAFNRSFDTMFEQILAFDAGAPIKVINPQALTRLRKRSGSLRRCGVRIRRKARLRRDIPGKIAPGPLARPSVLS
jgi:hypothetical protein